MTFLISVFSLWFIIMGLAFVPGLIYRNYRYLPVSCFNSLNSEIGKR